MEIVLPYRNLDKIFVKEGDKISLASLIDEAVSNYSGTLKELLFDIYYSIAELVDPEEWVPN